MKKNGHKKRHAFAANRRRQLTSEIRERKILTQRSEVKILNKAQNLQRPLRTGALADQTHSGYTHNGKYIFF